MVSIRCSFGICRSGLYTAKAIHTSAAHSAVVKSKWHEKIPDDVSVYDFVTKSISTNPEKIAMIDGISGKQYSYSDIKSLSTKFGSVLAQCGIKLDDKAIMYSPNCIDYGPALLGTLGIGGCVSTMNPLYTKREVVKQIEDSHAKVIFTVKPLLETAMEAAHVTGIKDIILLGSEDSKKHGVINLSDIKQDSGKDFANSSPKLDMKDHCAFLPYSSGTTGVPKGVVLTHHNIVSNLVQFGKFFDIVKREVALGLLPFFHIYGLTTILLSGMEHMKTTVTLPKFEPQAFLKSVQDYKIDYASLVPPLLLFLIKSPEVEKYDISSLQQVTTGAAPFGSDLWTSFNNRFQNRIKLIQGYGLSETSPVATLTPGDDVVVGSVGKAVPNSEIKIVDIKTGEALGPNQTGEVVIKGPHIMKGYLKNEKATSQCLTEDGWFYSGDVGYYDDDHNFYIVDRLKELIKYKGYQVAPAELEDLLMAHPQVADAAVIGIPDEEAGELPKAFIVAKEEIDPNDIINYIEQSVAPYKRLRGGVHFIDVIPKAASGKILRRELRDRFIQ